VHRRWLIVDEQSASLAERTSGLGAFSACSDYGFGIAGLFTHLAFFWDVVSYDENSANTGVLRFEADGTLIYALFGTNCGPSGFGCGVGNDPDPYQWCFDNYYGEGAFYYRSPTDPFAIFIGTTSLRPLPIPPPRINA